MTPELKSHTATLAGTYVVGMLTWLVELDKWVGRIGLWAGTAAAIMLIVIRWDDFMTSKIVCRWRERLKRWFRR